MSFKVTTLLLLALAAGVLAMDNGLARTPPMGWLSWLKFACNIDCKNYPNECINEKLYKDMIDHLAADGYLELGWNTVNIDDCWSTHTRDPTTKRLVPDPVRFPNGIKGLADYAHSKKILLGIYNDVGTKTCEGYPGMHDEHTGADMSTIDAQTYSDWGVDSLKLDGCYADSAKFNVTYPAMTAALKKVSHKIIYECSWPMFTPFDRLHETDYVHIRENCNYWRNHGDIMDSWSSVLGIINFYRDNAATFAKYHGPGGWFDADMLTIGNDGLSVEQAKSQMAFWSLWSVPLLVSNDLRTIKPEYKAILQNKHLIEVNQDALGIMGHIVHHDQRRHLDVWVKKLAPDAKGHNPYVVLYFNAETIGVPAIMSHKVSELIPDVKKDAKFDVHDLYNDAAKFATLGSDDSLTMRVPISGAVRIVKLVPVA